MKIRDPINLAVIAVYNSHLDVLVLLFLDASFRRECIFNG